MSDSRSEPPEQFRQGLALLDPANGVADWRRGIGLIEAASAAGLADATERRAIFACAGIGRTADWEQALDLLLLAAEQGSQSAAAQLRLMAGEEASTPLREARQRISIERLLGAGPVQLASISPRIGVVEHFASPAECGWLMEATGARLEPSQIYDVDSGSLRQDPQRTNRAAPCNPFHVGFLVEVIRARLSRCIGLDLPQYECSQVLHYSKGQEFRPHHDYFDPAAPGFQSEIAAGGQRIATQLIYLNENYEGGDTEFPSLGLAYRGRTGDALMFFNIDESGDPEPLTLHSGTPLTAGEKWIFSQWVRDRPPQAPSR